jgi:hypothetical protein
MNTTRPFLLTFIISACSFSIPVSATEIPPNTNLVAEVFHKTVSATEIGFSGSATVDAASKRLLDLIWREVGDRYAQKNNLVATDMECEAFEKFQTEVELRQREKRKQELSTIESQLKSNTLSEAKREELEQHRNTLLSLEKHEEQFKTLPIPEATRRRASRQWVTWFKVYKRTYEQYGGKVAITTFGLYPIEARRKLIEEHIRAGDVRFVDPEFETEFWRSYEKGGRFIAETNQIDFTPYWLKPIPNDPD